MSIKENSDPNVEIPDRPDPGYVPAALQTKGNSALNAEGQDHKRRGIKDGDPELQMSQLLCRS